MDPRSPEDGLEPFAQPEPDRVSRPLLLVVAVVLLTAATVWLVVGSTLLRDGDPTSPGAGASASARPRETPSSRPSPSLVPTPAATPSQLAAGSWAVVATDSLNLRDAPSTDAKVLGTAPAGRLVKVAGGATIVNGTPWYPVHAVAGSARAGWMAGEGDEVFLEPAAGTVTQTWCGRVEAETAKYDASGIGVRTVPRVRFGGLTLPSNLFEPGMQGALSVAWGAGTDVCMRLTIIDGELASVTIPTLRVEACGEGGTGTNNEMTLHVGLEAVSPSGTRSDKLVWLHEALLGFSGSGFSSSDLPNLAQALFLSAYGDGQACVSVEAAGGKGSTSLSVEVTTVGCVRVYDRLSGALTLQPFSLLNGNGPALSFDIVPNSEIGPEFVPGTMLGASVRAAGGPAGVISVEAVPVPDCS